MFWVAPILKMTAQKQQTKNSRNDRLKKMQ